MRPFSSTSLYVLLYCSTVPLFSQRQLTPEVPSLFASSREFRPDILVQMKKVRGIILILERYQASILLAIIGCFHPILTLITEEVHIYGAHSETLHCREKDSRPL